jgi:hypothetical protein
MGFQRLTSFSFKTLTQFANPKSLIVGAAASGIALCLINEVFVYVNYFLKDKKIANFMEFDIINQQNYLKAENAPKRYIF